MEMELTDIHPAGLEENPHNPRMAALDKLTGKFSELFKDELGNVSDLKVTLHVKPGVRPILGNLGLCHLPTLKKN